MKMKSSVSACIIACMLTLAGCMTMPTPAAHPTVADNNLAHQYGEEMLAYLMQVVLGKAGNPVMRATWSSRGLDQDLDIESIASVMSDPGGNKAALLVNDPNILGFSKILYHYAPEMSQFSGSYGTSLYPATELVALRLFLLKRLQAKRKVSIQSLIDHRQLLEDSQRQPTHEELAAMNLRPDEALLLQMAFSSKPWLFNCLTNPFMVEAFSKIGALEADPLTKRLISQAHYRNTVFTPLRKRPGRETLVVAFLPSMTKEFTTRGSGFIPTESYGTVVRNLETDILAACRRFALQALTSDPSTSGNHSKSDFEKHIDNRLSNKITFKSLDTRPLVIYPENASKVTRETCPDADFVVIILGRNVYQSMHIDQAKDIFPTVNRIFLDITDVKHSQVSSEVTEIGKFLYTKIASQLPSTIAFPRKTS